MSIASALLPNAIADWASLSFSIWLLSYMIEKESVTTYIAIIVFDAVLACLLFFLTLSAAMVILTPIIPEDSASVYGTTGVFELLMCILIVLATAILPTVVHAVYAMYLVASKATGKILRGPVSVICLRLYESEKGILTQISIFLGVVAKVSQETLKYVSG